MVVEACFGDSSIDDKTGGKSFMSTFFQTTFGKTQTPFVNHPMNNLMFD